MSVSLATTQTCAWQTFFACHKQKMFLKIDKKNLLVKQCSYTPLTKLLARQARPGKTHDESGTKAETYSSISATNQHQLEQKMHQ